MPIFVYQARDEKGRLKKGMLRAPDGEQGRRTVRDEGLELLAVTPYCAPPDFLPLFVSSVFFIFIGFALVMTAATELASGKWLKGLLHIAILAGILCFVLFAWRTHQRQSLARRTKAHLDVPRDGREAYLFESAEGEFLPEEEPKPVMVKENGIAKPKVLLGRIERSGFPNYAQMSICIAGYYVSALLIWSTLGAPERAALDRTIPVWGLAAGLSLLVLPALLVTLGLKLRLYAVATAAGIAALLQFLWLRGAYLHNPAGAPVYEILARHPLHTVLGWVLPAAVMIALERNRKIKDFLHLEVPVYDEGEGE